MAVDELKELRLRNFQAARREESRAALTEILVDAFVVENDLPDDMRELLDHMSDFPCVTENAIINEVKHRGNS